MAPLTLMTLPLEVRLTICKYALPDDAEVNCCTCFWGFNRRSPRATMVTPHERKTLRLVSKQFVNEIATIPRLPLTAKFCYWPCMRHWLNSVSFQHRDTIDRVRITRGPTWQLANYHGVTDFTDTQAVARAIQQDRTGTIYTDELRKYFSGAALLEWKIEGVNTGAQVLHMLLEISKARDQLSSHRLRPRSVT